MSVLARGDKVYLVVTRVGGTGGTLNHSSLRWQWSTVVW